MPTSIASFDVRWSELVTKVTVLAERDHPYLAAIARYSNNGGVPDGIFGLALDLCNDPQVDRLLSVVHDLRGLQTSLAAWLLGRTAAAAALDRFGSEAVIASRVEQAEFEYLSPFLLEGTLADEVFHYGMYRYFYEDHSAEKARELARQFLAETVGDELESVVPLTTRRAWGDWFDPHSLTDRSWLLVQRGQRRAWLLAFSHSD